MGTFTGEFISFHTLECANCHMPFAITEFFEKHRRKDHEPFWCPQGHSNVYSGKTEEQKLKEQLRREKLERESAEASSKRAWEKADKAILSQRAYKGQLTKARKRIAKGVCPCCNRQFIDLYTHMTNKHPDYAEEKVEVK